MHVIYQYYNIMFVHVNAVINIIMLPQLQISFFFQFRTFIISSDCLFSLINGDDMFNTYMLASNSSQPVKIFSKIYLYIFVALFIYVVLSVFISLIEDTYRIQQVS